MLRGISFAVALEGVRQRQHRASVPAGRGWQRDRASGDREVEEGGTQRVADHRGRSIGKPGSGRGLGT